MQKQPFFEKNQFFGPFSGLRWKFENCFGDAQYFNTKSTDAKFKNVHSVVKPVGGWLTLTQVPEIEGVVGQ